MNADTADFASLSVAAAVSHRRRSRRTNVRFEKNLSGAHVQCVILVPILKSDNLQCIPWLAGSLADFASLSVAASGAVRHHRRRSCRTNIRFEKILSGAHVQCIILVAILMFWLQTLKPSQNKKDRNFF